MYISLEWILILFSVYNALFATVETHDVRRKKEQNCFNRNN